MCKDRDGREAEGTGEETASCFGGDLIWRKDWRYSGRRARGRRRRRHADCRGGWHESIEAGSSALSVTKVLSVTVRLATSVD